MNDESDDSARYLESLQRELLSPGWESIFDFQQLREWVREHRENIRTVAKATLGDHANGFEDFYATIVENFSPRNNFDDPSTHAIFRPIFDDLVESATKLGIRPIRGVELIASTSISPTPLARPTTTTHQLFVGPGTSSFCNYWAKAYTASIKALERSGNPADRVETATEFMERIAGEPDGLFLACRLSIYYALFSTVLGFGTVTQPSEYTPYRLQLLRAMELFALGHEYAHFLADEREIAFVTDEDSSSDIKLELFCDQVGLQLSRHWGANNNN